MSTERRQRIYDHRLVRLVQETGDATIATNLGVLLGDDCSSAVQLCN